MTVKIFEPAEIKKLSRFIESSDEEYEELTAFFFKYKSYLNSTIDVPRWWAGYLLGYLQSMVRLDDGLKFSKISSDKLRLEIAHSYCARYKNELEAIKRAAAIEMDSLFQKKIAELDKVKGHLL